MPLRLHWTPQRDDDLKRMRASGASWDAIAAALGVGRNATIERGRRIGIKKRGSVQPPPAPPTLHADRAPLVAGHPRSWGEITRGTCLEGQPYPLPVFSL